MYRTRHGLSDEGGILILSIVVVAVLAVAFDAAIAWIGFEQLWPVMHTQPWVILLSGGVVWLASAARAHQ